ncbi:MAG: YicC/YloC family endoribonuclease [Rudaea sp.]|uniref:YicC/YloC family endoribonuclease n=1 Tax=Rudaea sp. TaxID=2136325 RepID=UPI0039E3A244
MIRSMTAFASADADTPWGALGYELRSVNSRYLEVSPRLPDELRAIEPAVRERIAAKLTRGKVDVSLRLHASGAAGEIRINEQTLGRLETVAHAMARRFPQLGIEFTRLLDWPGVLEREEVDLEGLRAAALDLLERALADMVATRQREGERLGGFLRERLDGIARIVADVRGWLPEIRKALRARLEARLAEIAQSAEMPRADNGRLEQELVLQLSRIDVDEELDRLTAHIAEARRILGSAEPAGRRLDFLMQEFNREANTLGSKSVDQRTTQAAIDLKVLIEQMREQVQNIE